MSINKKDFVTELLKNCKRIKKAYETDDETLYHTAYTLACEHLAIAQRPEIAAPVRNRFHQVEVNDMARMAAEGVTHQKIAEIKHTNRSYVSRLLKKFRENS